MNVGNNIIAIERSLSNKRMALWIALFLLLLFALRAFAAPDFVPGRILLKPREGLSEKQRGNLFLEHGAVERGRIAQIGVHVLEVPEAAHAHVLDALSHNPNVEFAEPDYVYQPELIPNDT
jgi:hypothetical protein